MRFVEKELAPKIPPGTERAVSYFALFPVKINKEARWLEQVTITQVFTAFKETNDDMPLYPYYWHDWKNIQFNLGDE